MGRFVSSGKLYSRSYVVQQSAEESFRLIRKLVDSAAYLKQNGEVEGRLIAATGVANILGSGESVRFTIEQSASGARVSIDVRARFRGQVLQGLGCELLIRRVARDIGRALTRA